MLTVEFYECVEIRLGSPFKGCQIRFQGEWLPPIVQDRVWQDRVAQDPTERYTALVYWDIFRNEPGFRVLILDAERRTLRSSARIVGLCQGLWWYAGEFKWQAQRVEVGSMACEDLSSS